MANYKIFYSMNEIAEMTGFSKPKLYELMDKGILPSIKVGKNRVFTQEHIKTFIKNCNITPPSSPQTELASANVL